MDGLLPDYVNPKKVVALELDGHIWHAVPGRSAGDWRKTDALMSLGYNVIRIREDPLNGILDAENWQVTCIDGRPRGPDGHFQLCKEVHAHATEGKEELTPHQFEAVKGLALGCLASLSAMGREPLKPFKQPEFKPSFFNESGIPKPKATKKKRAAKASIFPARKRGRGK